MTGGQFAKRLVKLCLGTLLAVLLWAMVLKTTTGADLTDVLTYAGGAFGGELLLLLIKRVLAGRSGKKPQDDGGTEL
jgi:hypothetical protein